MKTQNKNISHSGFTLVELLVVIAIIAVLASAGFYAGASAMQRARQVTAQATATSVVNAIEQFYSEYSALPDPASDGTDADTQFDTKIGNGVKLLNILAGLETGTEIQNEKKVRFLTLKEAKGGKRDGVVFSASGDRIESLFDPWGEPYYIVLDYDYSERLNVAPQGSSATNLNGRRAAVYSLGTDTPAEAKRNTLVKTW